MLSLNYFALDLADHDYPIANSPGFFLVFYLLQPARYNKKLKGAIFMNEMNQADVIIIGAGPVSYTHLDVYKRQIFDCQHLQRFSDF